MAWPRAWKVSPGKDLPAFWCSRLPAAPQPRLHVGSRPGPSSCFSPFPLLLQERETISSFHSSSMAGRLMNLSPAPRLRPAKNVCDAFRGPSGRLREGQSVATKDTGLRSQVPSSGCCSFRPLSSTEEMILHLQLLLSPVYGSSLRDPQLPGS